MSRSLKKGPFVETRLLSRITAMNEAGKKDVVKTWSRASTIFPEMVGHTIAVHDGRKQSEPVRSGCSGHGGVRRMYFFEAFQGGKIWGYCMRQLARHVIIRQAFALGAA